MFQIFRQDNLRRHQRVHVKEEYVNEHEFGHVCNVCGESFPEALDLLAHAEVHARSAEYRCMICGEIMSDESALAVHVQVSAIKQRYFLLTCTLVFLLHK